MPNRRHVLELLAAGAVSGCAAPSAADPAAAWRNPGAGERDPRRWALAHAILAPNPHNRQPWLVELPGTDEIRLYVDPARQLPATDPPARQITLGCGAFIELLDLAARERGLRTDVVLWPEGEPHPMLDKRPVAHIRLRPDPAAPRDPLFAQVSRRHTNRAPYDLAAPPTLAELTQVATAAGGPGLQASSVIDAPLRERLIDLGLQAYGIEMQTSRTHMESVRLMRVGANEIAQNPDGIALAGPAMEAMKAVGIITPASLADPASMASKSGFDIWRKMLAGTPAFFVLKSADNTRKTQIAAGRAYARAHLTAISLGLQMQPWSMGLQEFPEMAGPYAQTQRLLDATPLAPVQMLVRIGRAKAAPPAPRWPLETHIRT